MNFLIRNEYRAEIILSSTELESYGITYEEIDYGNIETRRLLWTLKSEVQKRFGYTLPLSGRLLIEVIKEQESSIRICFSGIPGKTEDEHSVKQLVKSLSGTVIAEFTDFEDMLFAVSLLDGNTESSLFEKNGKYRILFSPDEKEREELIFCLCEFSEIWESSLIKEATCREMWHMLAENNAVSLLHGLF